MWGLLCNPLSGGGKGKRIKKLVEAELSKLQIEYRDFSGSDLESAIINLKELPSLQLEGLIVIGGDGMVHLAIQSIAKTKVALMLIPAGTGNDFARSLNLPLSKPLTILNTGLNSKPKSVDLGVANNRFFAEVLSTGFDSVVNEKANRIKLVSGKLKYQLAIALVLFRFKPTTYQFRIDGVTFTSKAMLIAVANGESYGGGMRIAPKADLQDGVLDVMILGPISKWEFIRVFPKVYKGQHVNHPAVKFFKATEIEISADTIAYADGERIGKLPVLANIAPSALRVFY